jgi:hypothetical protein
MAKEDGVILAVYTPPAPDLPFLAVAVYPNGDVQGFAADTPSAARKMVDGLSKQLGRTEASGQP